MTILIHSAPKILGPIVAWMFFQSPAYASTGDDRSLSQEQIESMVDDGRVITCESVKPESRCSDAALEQGARRDYVSRDEASPVSYLLANRESGNVWGLQIRRIAFDGGSEGPDLSVEALVIPRSIAGHWLEYLQMTQEQQ